MTQYPWQPTYPNELKSNLNIPCIPLTKVVEEAAEFAPENIAISFFRKKINYKKLLQYIYQFANYLAELGIKKGDRVALMLPNCPQAVICYYGTLLIGGIVVQLNPLSSEREIDYILKDSGARVIVCLDLLFSKAENVTTKLPQKPHYIITSIKDFLPLSKKIFYSFTNFLKQHSPKPNVPTLKNILKHTPNTPIHINIDAEKDVAVIQYTGGTTGRPKGAMLTHQNLVANAYQCRAWFYKCKDAEQRILSVIPLFHVYGMTACLNTAMVSKSTLILIPKFDVNLILKTIAKEKPTIFPGVPTLYKALLNHSQIKKYNLSSIEACISGSAPLPNQVKVEFEKITGGKLVEGYGLTEASAFSHCNLIWGTQVLGSIGIPCSNTECKIIDPYTSNEVNVGEIGEVVIKGPQVMKGYWNQHEETKEVLKDGWLKTGDMGYMNQNGYFYIVDRKKDVIIAGGFNIYPREVEDVLMEHPGVKEAAVIGVPDSYRGESVKAYIVKDEHMEVDIERLNQYCRKHLSAYKIPRYYEFREELPKSTIGKVLRKELKKDFEVKSDEHL